MFFKQQFLKNKNDKQAIGPQDINHLFTKAKKSSDFGQLSLINKPGHFILSYYNTLIDREQFQCKVLYVFQEPSFDIGHLKNIEDIRNTIPIEDILITDNIEVIESKFLKGYAILQIKENDYKCALINLSNEKVGLREQNNVENEFSVVGPQIGFVENVDINIHLLRQQISTPNLIIEDIHIGSMSHTKVIIAYIEGITNEQHIQTMTQRLQNIDFDVVFDSSQLHQIITDNSLTPFPLLLIHGTY